MNNNQYITKLHNALCPSIYSTSIPPGMGIDLLLVRTTIPIISRYAFVVSKWDHDISSESQLLNIRTVVKKLLHARWIIREVGLHILFYGPKSNWEEQCNEIVPDKTGSNAVIIQGIQFVDFETGQMKLQQSSWGPIKFGFGKKVTDAVSTVLQQNT